MRAKRALLRAAIGLAAFSAAATAVIGVAHTPWGRPLLKLPLLSSMASRAGCPVGTIEPAAFEKVRTAALKHEVGTAAAKGHPALSFTLGTSARADVEKWANERDVDCKAGSVASVLECKNITVVGGPMISTLRLQFDGQERLVSVDLFRSASPSAELVQRFVNVGAELDAKVGPPVSMSEPPTVGYMSGAPLRTAIRDYRYRDYVAKVTLINMGKRGLKLRERYQWLAEGTAREPS